MSIKLAFRSAISIDAFVADDAAGRPAGPEKLGAAGTGEADLFWVERAVIHEVSGKIRISEGQASDADEG